MLCGKFCSPKYIVAAILAVMALVAFNVGRPGIENETAAAFNSWYKVISDKLTQPGAGQDSSLVVQVTISIRDNSTRDTPTVWIIPSTSLADPVELQDTARVLQLIRESGVFGLPASMGTSAFPSSISFSVRDGSKQFDITLPYNVVENSIQLQNLLTFLEVRSNNQQSAPSIEPARL